MPVYRIADVTLLKKPTTIKNVRFTGNAPVGQYQAPILWLQYWVNDNTYFRHDGTAGAGGSQFDDDFGASTGKYAQDGAYMILENIYLDRIRTTYDLNGTDGGILNKGQAYNAKDRASKKFLRS